jgi:bacteriorhodopsin
MTTLDCLYQIMFLCFVLSLCLLFLVLHKIRHRGRRGRDSMVVGFTTTYAISAYLTYGEVYSIQSYVIQFVSDSRQVCDFLCVLLFPPPIQLTATI